MSPTEDAERWNERYLNNARYALSSPRQFLKSHLELLPTPGIAIDLAMGLGGNAGFLLQHGLSVVGVDISEVALRKAKKQYPKINAILADLTYFNFPANSFDVILCFFYLERLLWPKIPEWLKPDGLLVMEALTMDMRIINPKINPRYLLWGDELHSAFPQLKNIFYEEGWYGDIHPRPTARLISRKI